MHGLSNWQDMIPETVVTTALAVALRWCRWGPRRFLGFLIAVWNREKLRAIANAWMEEAQQQEAAGQRWMRLHNECQAEVTRLDTEVARLRGRAGANGESGAGGNSPC